MPKCIRDHYLNEQDRFLALHTLTLSTRALFFIILFQKEALVFELEWGVGRGREGREHSARENRDERKLEQGWKTGRKKSRG